MLLVGGAAAVVAAAAAACEGSGKRSGLLMGWARSRPALGAQLRLNRLGYMPSRFELPLAAVSGLWALTTYHCCCCSCCCIASCIALTTAAAGATLMPHPKFPPTSIPTPLRRS